MLSGFSFNKNYNKRLKKVHIPMNPPNFMEDNSRTIPNFFIKPEAEILRKLKEDDLTNVLKKSSKAGLKRKTVSGVEMNPQNVTNAGNLKNLNDSSKKREIKGLITSRKKVGSLEKTTSRQRKTISMVGKNGEKFEYPLYDEEKVGVEKRWKKNLNKKKKDDDDYDSDPEIIRYAIKLCIRESNDGISKERVYDKDYVMWGEEGLSDVTSLVSDSGIDSAELEKRIQNNERESQVLRGLVDEDNKEKIGDGKGLKLLKETVKENCFETGIKRNRNREINLKNEDTVHLDNQVKGEHGSNVNEQRKDCKEEKSNSSFWMFQSNMSFFKLPNSENKEFPISSFMNKPSSFFPNSELNIPNNEHSEITNSRLNCITNRQVIVNTDVNRVNQNQNGRTRTGVVAPPNLITAEGEDLLNQERISEGSTQDGETTKTKKIVLRVAKKLKRN